MNEYVDKEAVNGRINIIANSEVHAEGNNNGAVDGISADQRIANIAKLHSLSYDPLDTETNGHPDTERVLIKKNG